MSDRLWLGSAALMLVLLFAGMETVAGNAGRALQVEGPVTAGERGYPYSASIVPLTSYGYSEFEYFVAGNAHAFVPAPESSLGEDGRWHVLPGEAVPFKTRVLVRRPGSGAFNGTVVVEFMQEYFGSERDTNYRWVAEALLRRGYAWVGVSLHHEGIDDTSPQQSFSVGGQTVTTGLNLARWDAARYASLSVPSSDLSYDILAQVAAAIRSGAWEQENKPLAGLAVERVLAAGNTIAAKRLGVFINAVQPLTNVFDGFYLQDWTPNEVALSAAAPVPRGYQIRDDAKTPVIIMNTTTAVVELGEVEQTARLRYWTPAGSSHTTGPYMVRVGKANARDFGASGGFCPPEVANDFPVRYFARAALVALDQWAATGKAPPGFDQLQRLEVEGGWDVPRDVYGNALGGLRSPWVDVPVKRYDWRGECMGGSGQHARLPPETLSALYGSPENYHQRFEKALEQAVADGRLLDADAAEALAAAREISW